MAIELNEEQQKPANHLQGAVLVTAGAGSGKTRLLTQRIANLVASGVSPREILCITFTNKAAGEMKARLGAMMDTSQMWIMTFHAMCLRLLRYHADALDGYTKNFTVYTEAEKERVLKRLLSDRDLDATKYFKSARRFIGDSKNGIRDEEYDRFADTTRILNEIAQAYQEEMRRCDAMDFDDLLLNCYRMLIDRPDVLEYEQDRFRYISVDEFQDTNRVQYEILKLLGAKYGNVFVVGDEDQSVYGWRGANIQNIFDFVRDFHAATYKLERNYRSTSRILSAANAIISHNKTRLDKKLWTDKGEGAKIERFTARNDSDEAEYVVRCIDSLVRYNDYKYSDVAVLMRLNALTRSFEERLLAYNIPYNVYGGHKFYDRKEVKDLLAYLRLAVNPRDDEAVMRTINVPRRGIGDGALSQLRAYCRDRGLSLNECCKTIRSAVDLPASLVKKIAPYGDLIRRITELAVNAPPDEVTDFVADESGYLSMLRAEENEEGRSRLANIGELMNAVAEYARANPGAGLARYLESVALSGETDSYEEDGGAVTLATVHLAKGLEFKVVFVVGLDEGVFPLKREEASEMEEERRLMYVAVTRAEERLYFTRAYSRRLYGKSELMAPSRFLAEDGSESRTFDAPARAAVANRHALPVSEKSAPKEPAVDPKAYPVGTVVMHKAFGRGVITAQMPLKDMTIVTVRFDTVGNKNLGLGLVKLEIVQ